MPDNNFSKNNRLLSASDFSYVRKNAKVRQNRWIRIYFKQGSQDRLLTGSESRIGIAVTKKVGNAVVRVAFKRVLREAFRASAYKNQSIDFVVTVSPNILKKHTRKEAIKLLKSSFLSILPQLTMIKP